jgi:mono/diheme cytochrome c family protein
LHVPGILIHCAQTREPHPRLRFFFHPPRTHMKALKWIFGTLGVLIVLAVVAALFLMNKGASRFEQTWEPQVDMVSISSDSASLALGKFIAESHGCQNCHGGDFSGDVMIDAPPFLVAPTNLTSGTGGIGTTYTDEDWVRAIRHGVNPAGRGLMVMPSEAYYYLNDEEMAALVAYLKTLNPVDHELPATEMRPLGKLIMGLDPAMATAPEMMSDRPRVTGVERGVTADWGHYRASVVCMVCHGGDLQGGQRLDDPEAQPAPDLRVVAGWGQDAFLEFFRTGVNPSGVEISKDFMPWDKFSHLGEDELTAVYLYLETLN